jgi:two-component system response regulator YesN
MLIVDDEPIICRGLRDTIPWDEYNVEIIDIAHDGEDAIRKIQEHENVDLVISDVRMPNVDGLQLASYLHHNYPNISMIMISGYDEFAYAQKAIQLGVEDYLLKPVNIDVLLSRVIKLTNEIQEFQNTDFRHSILQQISDYPGEIAEGVQAYHHIKIYPFISFIRDYMVKIKGLSDDEIENQKKQWKGLIDTTLKVSGFDSISIFIDENTLLTCIQVKDDQSFSKEVLSLLKNETQNNEYTLTFIGSDQVITVARLKERLIQLTKMISYSHIKENVSIVYANANTKMGGNDKQKHPHKLEARLIDMVFQSESEHLEDLSHHLFDYFKVNDFILKEVVQACCEILTKLINHSKSIHSDILKELVINYERPIDVNLYNSYQALQELFNQDLDAICSRLNLKTIHKTDWMIEQAENYIKEFYKSNIKAHEVADIINISPNYFSSLFNERTGKGFNEYVNHLRIEEAKKLLTETPFKVHEIAELVGFQEYKYFVKVFKEMTNMTPMKYRKLTTTK